MEERIDVDGLALAFHVARPATTASVPAVVLCHDFPTPPRGSLASGLTFPELADRIARDVGWMVFTFNFRGTGGSEGDFSIGGWLADQRMAVDFLSEREEVSGVWMVGTGVGGTLALCTAAGDERVRGVATLGAQATLRGWETSRFIDHCRRLGVLRSPGAPTDPAAWAREIAEVDAVAAARKLAPRPLLVLHGSDDDVAPLDDARILAEAHGSAELRVVLTAGRRIRHDPRAIASLFGWLDRQML
ncbi:MAG: alpha/beta hydrolase family protein [Acidimicrobiia bacterium]